MKKIVWAVFGNDEDGIYGTDAWFHSLRHSRLIAFVWWWRNPFHNFFWHVANWPNDKEPTIFADHGFKGRWVPPLISYRGTTFEWYIGFRSTQGVFGMSFRRVRSKIA